MLLQYFGYRVEPFGVTPDPRCLYPSQTHREALASIRYGFQTNRGFTALIAPPGMGKTTLLRRFLEDVREITCSVFLFNVDPACEPREFVSYILREIGIAPGSSSAEMHEQLSDALVKETRAGTAPRQVVFCGVDGENGSSAVCALAGRTLAANSTRKVCLVEANMRSPRLAAMFGIEGTNPISGTSAPLRDGCVKVGSNLWLAGPNILADKSRILLPPVELKERLAELRGEFEHMLIDAPGTSVCGDAQLLSLVADAAILVIEANSTRRLTARNAKESLEASGVRLLGTVLYNRSFPIPEMLYRRF